MSSIIMKKILFIGLDEKGDFTVVIIVENIMEIGSYNRLYWKLSKDGRHRNQTVYPIHYLF